MLSVSGPLGALPLGAACWTDGAGDTHFLVDHVDSLRIVPSGMGAGVVGVW